MLKFNGQSLIANAVNRAKPQVSTLVVCTNDDPGRFGDLSCPVITDAQPGYLGPAAGIISAFRWAQHSGTAFNWLMSFAADTPLFPLDLSAQLLSHAGKTQQDIIIPTESGRSHYVFALWHRRILHEVEAQFLAGERALKRLIQPHSHTSLALPSGANTLFNINTPEQWQTFRNT